MQKEKNHQSKISFEKDWCMRNVHMAAIKQMATDIEENLESYLVISSLDERVKKLQSDMNKLEAKNLAIVCNEKGSVFNAKDFDEENVAIVKLCMDLKARIRAKMAKLSEASAMANVKVNSENEFGKVNTGSNGIKENTDGVKQALSTQNEQAIQVANEKAWMSALKFSVPDWHQFESEFSGKVLGNDDFSNEEKFIILLKACASSEAEQVLARLCEKEAEMAFGKLKEKFGTAYAQVNFFTQALMNTPDLTQKIPSQYMSMVNTVEYCIAGLKRHMIEQQYEQLVAMIVINKLN